MAKKREKITKKISKKIVKRDIPTLKIIKERDIALDFAVKAYQKFDKLIKSVVFFGSKAKKTSTAMQTYI